MLSVFRICLGSPVESSYAELIPIVLSLLPHLVDIPHMSSSSKLFRTLILSDSSRISKTFDSSYFLACLFAAFANVLDGPMPIEIGIPVHCFICLRISSAVSFKSQ